ncbi:Sec34-domain-containing protein [Piedraia hortae CBS 480.64]|uniref:Conserved oligomeric Golgi complex subunit 3 n=1 Tax=Piedraia hortae CBS 480.64 TaxID=1314780 RepID=A0A6A7CAF8_9PEZI|nr:Sec34-domain-containing protein [Piedraia hortae CBS 480.64]
MDDAWFHSFTTSLAPATEKKRRQSLFQRPAIETPDEWKGPPKATPPRRAQSSSACCARKERHRPRRLSVDEPKDSEEDSFNVEFLKHEATLLEESHAKYQTYLEQLQFSAAHMNGILASTTETLNMLARLSNSFKAVEEQTEAFQQQCESLVKEQKRLGGLADAIEENLRYYTFLEPMTRRLNAPGAANLVKGEDFPEMLFQLDNCLAYLESHPEHKESAAYRSRYRLLLTRGLTLIRHHFTKSLGEIAADVSRRVQGALLYAKFRALGLEIQKRAVPTPDDVDAGREPEYASLLRELYQSYTTTRGRLILPMVSKKMVELDSGSLRIDVLGFAKSSLGFMRGICLDEYELWFEWFETDGALYEFLESLMEPMYDYLRPKIIHETKLEKLCELSAMIQGAYVDVDDEEDDVTSLRPRQSSRKLNFARLAHPALEDAQTRLVFLAITMLRDGIEHYKPKPEDLDWPKSSNTSTKGAAVLSGIRKALPMTGEDGTTGQWYPTLPKAIWLLRRIYRLVNSVVFDDLAHRIVHSTIQSLLYARQQISSKKSSQDSQLFLMIHLLRLKQQIVAFDIEFSPPEVDFDFSSITNTFYELRERGALWNPASWVRLVSGVLGGGLLPKVVENMLDAKAELDGRLRTVINDFVNEYASRIAESVEKITPSFDALKAVQMMQERAEKEAPRLRTQLQAYIDDARTRETLVAAVRNQTVLAYEDFFETYRQGSDKPLSRKGKAREGEVWSPEIFGEKMERIFQVGPVIE